MIISRKIAEYDNLLLLLTWLFFDVLPWNSWPFINRHLILITINIKYFKRPFPDIFDFIVTKIQFINQITDVYLNIFLFSLVLVSFLKIFFCIYLLLISALCVKVSVYLVNCFFQILFQMVNSLLNFENCNIILGVSCWLLLWALDTHRFLARTKRMIFTFWYSIRSWVMLGYEHMFNIMC